MTARDLFGGAIQVQLPESFQDVSDIRQVPSHQECWQEVNLGQLLVVEIVEYQGTVANEAAAAYFFQDLSEANGCNPEECTFEPQEALLQVNGLPASSSVWFGTGFHQVRLGREFDVDDNPRPQEERGLQVELCVVRLPSVASDILITLSSPSAPNPQENRTTDVFQLVVQSFQIADWTLFG